MKKQLISYIKTNYQFLINIYLFVNFLGYTVYQGYLLFKNGTFNFIEISFILQNIVLTSVVIIRTPHKTIDTNLFHQLIALCAFFSGAAFMGQTPTANATLTQISAIIILTSNIIGIITLLNLGRSFGILIARRQVKTKGAYSLIRHPMYFSDILLRIGFVLSHLNTFTIIAFILSSACYVYRALLEEKHLSKSKEYQLFMKKVRYRFIPFIF
jgi:protein-S-isoprenylcysteine O-methyltransferase Ste14